MSFSKCRELFRVGLVESLARCESPFREVLQAEGVKLFPVNGFALRILPWQRDAWMSFRVHADGASITDCSGNQVERPIGEWKHHDLFTQSEYSQPLAKAALYAYEQWQQPPVGVSCVDIAHLVFLAGAEALLDQTVTESFYAALGITERATAFETWFEYIVLDDDRVFKGNYCDVVLANRRTERTLPAWP